MKHVYKLIFIALLLLGLCVGLVQGATYLQAYDGYKVLGLHNNESTMQDSTGKTVTNYRVTLDTTNKYLGAGSGYWNGISPTNLSLADSNSWVLSQGSTIMFWSNLSSTGDLQSIVSQITGASEQFDLTIDSSVGVNVGKITLVVNNTNFIESVPGAYKFDTTWKQVVIQINGTNSKIYVNGTDKTNGISTISSLPDIAAPLHVGSLGFSSGYYPVKGNLDEIHIWDGVTIPISELYPQVYEVGQLLPPLTANFTISNTSGFEPLLTHFTDTSTTTDATIDAWNWSFDDGEVSSTQSPDHTYVNNGTYSVNLTITNTSYSLVSTKIQTVTVYNLPNCDFSSFNTAGTAPFTTYLYDTSTNLNPGPYTYYTDFGDGNTSTEQNLYFTWNITGTYEVKHCITDSVTTACNNKTAYVTVGTPTPPVVAPVASFYGGPQTGNVPLTVLFTDVSSNTPTSWNWSFGDGIYSELQNPSHAYTRSGFRTVNLTATNSAGSNVTTRLKFVKVS
jgi:PKD repeat protein